MKTKKMNYTFIIILSTFGLVMGALSVKGYTQKIEPFLWLALGIFASLVISKNISEKTFLHALVIGLLWGILNGITQSVFFDKYMANNTSLQDSFKKVTFVQPRYFVLMTAPVIGLITGAVLGGLSLLLKKLWQVIFFSFHFFLFRPVII